ncbi:MAG: glutathione peroxidase [Phycisphaeraceae bacterium]|nr:MAG: glutathione peroxidase [Phycisphaeraceae bacterium]
MAPQHPADVLRYEMNRIDGTLENLDDYRGSVVLIVNTASECGLTPQYEALETIYKERKDRGFVVLGFPANEFMGQEPGSNEEIAAFCTERFDVSFPMFEKIVVKGEGTHPLYKQLAELPEPLGGEPKWNFTKFLVDRRGKVVARFEPRVKPDDERVIEAIERLLSQKPATRPGTHDDEG